MGLLDIGDASSIRPAVVFAENWYHPSLGTDPAQDIHGPPKEECRRQRVQDDKDGVMRQKGGILSTNKAKFWNKSQAKGYGHAEVDIAGGEEEYEERPLHGPSATKSPWHRAQCDCAAPLINAGRRSIYHVEEQNYESSEWRGD